MTRRLLKWSLRGLIAVAALLLIAAIALAIVLNTRPGTRWALDRAAGAMPGALEVSDFEGTLWRGLQGVDADYADAGLELRIEDLEARLDWVALVRGRVVLTALGAATAHVRLPDSAAQQPRPFELGLAPLPRPVSIPQAALTKLVVEQDGAARAFEDIVLREAAAESDRLRLAALTVTGEGLSIQATGLDLRWSGDAPLRSELAWTLVEPALSGNGTVRGSLAELSFEQEVQGAYPAAVRGTARILHRVSPDLDLFVGPAGWQVGTFTVAGGTLHLAGVPDAYRTDFDLSVVTPDWGTVQVSGAGQGNLEFLTKVEARLQASMGAATLAGRLAWLPEPAALLDIGLSGLDASVLHPDLDGSLEGTAVLVMTGLETVDLNDMRISGLINGMPLAAAGSLALTSASARCRDCTLTSGVNSLAFDGHAGLDRLDLGFSIDAPSLQRIWPDLAGQLRGQGRLQGTPALPVFSGELTGADLAFGDWAAGSLNLRGHASSMASTDLDLDLDGLRYGGFELGTLSLNGRGNAAAMDVEIDGLLAGREVAAAAAIESGPGGLAGSIRRVAVTDPHTGAWSLAGEPRFRLHDGRAEVGPHAWLGAGGEIGIDRLSYGDSGIGLTGRVERLPLHLANSLLPPEYQLAGMLDADIDVRQASGQWDGTIEWRQNGTALRVQQADGEPVEIRIPKLDIVTRLEGGGARASAAIGIEPDVTGSLLAEFRQLSPDSEFSAELSMGGKEWSWLSAILPQVDQFTGTVTADLTAAGTLRNPVLGGGFRWREGRMLLPALNAPIDQISVDVEGAPKATLAISGSGRAGAGSVSVQGTIAGLASREPIVRLRLQGEDAELLNWPEYRVVASPDVTIDGDRNGWKLGGALRVPSAMITVKELPAGAVKPSADVRIAGAAEPQAAQTGYSGELDLVLGDDVRVNVFGLDTRLTGELLFRVPRDRPPAADGQVTLVGGVFSAYGQKLTIEQGTLTFTGPLDDPLVDVRAARVIETMKGPITAGIHLRGRAQNLSSTVYSQPAMAEADALSYLVLGRPLSQATAAEGNDLSGAAVALGLGRTTRITEQIARTLGLDQFTLAGDGGDATALVAGKQINPRLYARYAYGVFSRIGTLLLRYQLSTRLTLEASTGETQSIDLLYTIEKP